MDKEKMGKFISEARKAKGLTQKDLASIIYISDKAVSKWERGLSFPDIEILESLAGALDVSIVELLKSERIKKLEPDTESLIKDTLQLTKDENKKNKKRNIVISSVIITILTLLGIIFFYLTTPKYDKNLASVQDYILGKSNIIGEVNTDYFLNKSEDFMIGATKSGMAVFVNPDKAFKTLKKNYKDGIRLIRKEFCKSNLSKRNFDCYKNLGWQVTSGTSNEKEEARFVSSFMDIYENSFSEETRYKMMSGIHFYF